MKRFLLFTGDQYYPGGGWQDYKARFTTRQEALRAAAGGTRNVDLVTGSWDWWQIVDVETGKIVEEGTSSVIGRDPGQEE